MRARLILILSLVFVLCSGGALHAEERDVTYGDLHAVVWTPDQTLAAPAPVVIFSHGFHGCATQSRYLTTALAAAGYVVLAPNHADAVCHDGKASILDRSQEPFRDPSTWNDATYRDRANDIQALIAAVKADNAFAGKLDWGHLGLIGHSLGGYTVLGLAGAWPSWKMDGVKAVLALSPYVQPYNLRETLHGLAAPVMYQGGTRDFAITPQLHKDKGSYEQSPVPKFFVELDGGRHLSFSDRGSAAEHRLIVAYGIGFLDTYVKGLPLANILLTNGPGVKHFALQVPAAQMPPDLPPHAKLPRLIDEKR